MELDRLVQLLRALEKEKVDYVVVGGVALNLHGIVRATQDIDLFVRPGAENIERLKRALRKVWADPEIDSLQADELLSDYPTIRYGPPKEDFVIDLITRLGTAFRYEDIVGQTVSWNGVNVRIATPETLYKMKKDTLRPVDQADAAELRQRFSLGED